VGTRPEHVGIGGRYQRVWYGHVYRDREHLYCYDLAGTETWNLTVNGTPQKIVSTQDGDRALLYTDNDIVYYDNGTDGDVVAEYQMAGVGRAKDVTMKKDGQVVRVRV
jgi:hypothetical protein